MDRRFLELFLDLRVLSLTNCQLRSLAHFPKLPTLLNLNLADNYLSNSLKYLPRRLCLPQAESSTPLTNLNISNNQFSDPQALEPLLYLPNLNTLDIRNNPLKPIPPLFSFISSLQIFNGMDRDGADVVSEEEDGIEDLEQISGIGPGKGRGKKWWRTKGTEENKREDDKREGTDTDSEGEDEEMVLDGLKGSDVSEGEGEEEEECKDKDVQMITPKQARAKPRKPRKKGPREEPVPKGVE